MTPEERAWCEDVRSRALAIVTKCGRVQQNSEEGTEARRLAREAGLLAMALMQSAANRLTASDVAAEAQGVAAGGYDLSALASAPPGTVQE